MSRDPIRNSFQVHLCQRQHCPASDRHPLSWHVDRLTPNYKCASTSHVSLRLVAFICAVYALLVDSSDVTFTLFQWQHWHHCREPLLIILESLIDGVPGYYFYLIYFHYLCTWYNIGETKVTGWIKRDIRQGMTLEYGKTHCG